MTISKEAQALAFMAGANAIFTGEKLLTTPNPEKDADYGLLAELGLKPRAPYKDEGRAADACCGGGCKSESAVA